MNKADADDATDADANPDADIEDLPPAEATAYETLADVQPTTARAVAEKTPHKYNTIRDALPRLVDKGLVERYRVPGDARVFHYRRLDSPDAGEV